MIKMTTILSVYTTTTRDYENLVNMLDKYNRYVDYEDCGENEFYGEHHFHIFINKLTLPKELKDFITSILNDFANELQEKESD